jgi:hypothetical protein
LYQQERAVDFLTRLLRECGRLEEAESVLRAVLVDRQQKLGDDHVITNYSRADLAEVLVDLKKHSEAEELLQQAEKGLLTEARVPTPQRARVARLFVTLYEQWGKPHQASQWRAKLDELSKSAPTGNP